jgi:hypothetical protein
MLSKRFRIEDTLDRYEWLGRRSIATHDRDVFWRDGVDGLDNAFHAEFARWLGLYIPAWNPEPGHGAHRMDEIGCHRFAFKFG